jgi:O-antigen/teichoic acid export membrane protein
MYHKIQRLISIIVFPLGVGIYLYRDFATRVLLGSQWAEASGIIGIWALTRSIMIVFGNLCSEAYRAKGKPKLSFWAQVFHLVVLIPVCIISAKQGFWSLVYARSWIQMQAVLVHFIIMWYVIGIPVWQTLRNVIPTAVSAVLMGAMGYVLQRVYTGMAWDFISILICIGVYFCILCLFPVMRSELKILLKGLRSGSDI